VTDHELDALLGGLEVRTPSVALQRAILEQVGVEDRRIDEVVGQPRRARRWPWAIGGALALAAAVILALRVAPEPTADLAQLMQRGVGDPVTALSLRVAVRHGDTVERFAAGRVYHAGDTLIFRVSASETTEVTLRRGSSVLYTGRVGPGDTDLPVGYQLEAGEGPSRFTIEGGGSVEAIELPAVSP
jgi:hypothetical protein